MRGLRGLAIGPPFTREDCGDDTSGSQFTEQIFFFFAKKRCEEQIGSVSLSERVASLGIMRAQLKTPLKFLHTVVL